MSTDLEARSVGLVADIGGTNARFALVAADGEMLVQETLQCSDFEGPIQAARAFLQQVGVTRMPPRAAMAVASPVTSDYVHLTNNPWAFTIRDTKEALHLDRLRVVNDFVAQALAVPHLQDKDVVTIGPNVPGAEGEPILVMGPGTGLGVATLVFCDDTPLVLPGEGGHSTLPAITDHEARLISHIRKHFGHVSAERVLSGEGLVNLYRAVTQDAGQPLTGTIEPADVSRRALDGSDPLAAETLRRFFRFLGVVAGNKVLTVGARGGLVLAGGILPRMVDALRESEFHTWYTAKGRFHDYLSDIPVRLMVHPYPAFLGLASLVTDMKGVNKIG